MKIKKSSWHYKLLKFFDAYPIPDNLCPYVRKVIANMFFGLFIITLGFLVLIELAYPVWRWWGTDGIIGFISFASWIAIGIGSLKWYRESWRYKYKRSDSIWHRDLWPKWIGEKLLEMERARYERSKVKAARPPSLFVRYVRATHDKICPGIEFKDEL